MVHDKVNAYHMDKKMIHYMVMIKVNAYHMDKKMIHYMVHKVTLSLPYN